MTLVTLGFTEAEVIRMATGNTSRFPMLPDGLGTIAPGSVADLLLLPDDPLDDIGALTSPAVVVKDGRIVVDRREGVASSGPHRRASPERESGSRGTREGGR